MARFVTVLAGALLFLWPALVNGYPLVFSDTGGLLAMALAPEMGWDKPWVYSPFLLLLDGRTSLWLAVLGQALLLSHILWLAASCVRRWSAGRHLALCAMLAATTAAPWFASQVMPDIFAPLTVLCLFALAWPERLNRLERGWLIGVGSLAIAVHLSHLVLAAACILLAWPMRRPLLWRPAAPLGIAAAILLFSNIVGNGVVGISPYGSVFMLARLVADGPARSVVDANCPQAGWHICAWAGRLPTNSDAFLWDPKGPVWDDGHYGPTLFAAEASRIVRATLLAHPLAVGRAMLLNTARQLALTDLGDALGPDYLNVTVLPRLQAYFPPEEVARFQASLQAHGTLRAIAAPLLWPQRIALGLGLLGTIMTLALWRRDPRLAAFAAFVLVSLAANAFGTGALSGPHGRYQARIAWLLLVPPILLAERRVATRRVAQPRPALTAPAPHSREAAAP